MQDEIVKTARPGASSAQLQKMRDAKAAKKASAPARLHKQDDDDEGQVAAGRVHADTGRVAALGRDGELLSRSVTLAVDEFDIPKHKWPKGWDYQWNTISVHGNADIAASMFNHMQQQGWRSVPAERYAGSLLPKSAKGAILRKGMILEERPTTLGDEARLEDLRNARKLISDRNESLKLAGVKANMPDGFEMSGKYKGTGGDIRMSIDKGLDIPTPSHTLANPGDE